MRQEEFEQKWKEYKEAYDRGFPLISDDEFDLFEAEGMKLFPDSAVFNIVGLEEISNKMIHKIPMMSLDKTKDIIDLLSWIGNKSVVSTQKLDGCSCSLIYKGGNFLYGATRGDGFVGQDITKALNNVSFPKSIYFTGDMEIRGELVITKTNFEILKKEMVKRGLDEPKSRRNIIPGLINPLRKEDTDLSRFINFIGYDIISNIIFKEEVEKLDFLKFKLDFRTPEYIKLDNDTEVHNIINDFKIYKANHEIKMDGLVFTYNDISLHNRSDKNPEYKMAFKLVGDVVATPVVDIIFEMTGSGRLSYVAEVFPVEIDESTITRVTLHNMDYIKQHKISIGSVIGIVRSGDVIPKHQITLIENGEYVFPTKCPVCNSMLHNDGAFQICNNINCKAKAIGKINRWIDIINAKGISDKTIDALYNAGLIKTTSDLYRLSKDVIAVLDGFGDRSAELIINTMSKHKEVSYEDIIRGCNIPNLGKSTSKVLIDKYETIEKLCEYANYDDLETLSNIGEETALLILKHKSEILDFYTEMKEVVKIKQKEIIVKASDKLVGKSFCCTGTLSTKRDDVENLIKENGGVIKSVSKNLDYLVVGIDPGSKVEKAKSAGVEIISENDLYKMIR